jgi:hypothetical protein
MALELLHGVLTHLGKYTKIDFNRMRAHVNFGFRLPFSGSQIGVNVVQSVLRPAASQQDLDQWERVRIIKNIQVKILKFDE